MFRSANASASLAVAFLTAGLSLSNFPVLVSAEGSLRGGGGIQDDVEVINILQEDDQQPRAAFDEFDLMLSDPSQRRMLENHDHLGPVPLDGMLQDDEDYGGIDDGAFLDPFEGGGDRLLEAVEDSRQLSNGRFDRTQSGGRHGGNDDASGFADEQRVEKRIVNGHAAATDFKAMGITMKKSGTNYFKGHCGCTAIGRMHVVLAAHCHSNMGVNDLGGDLKAVYFNPQSIYKVVNGKGNGGQPYQVRDIAWCKRHYLHRPGGAASHDCMVCKLTAPIHDMIYEDVPDLSSREFTDSLTSSTTVTATGMGQTAHDAAQSLVNLQVHMKWVPWNTCKGTKIAQYNFDRTMVCAGGDGRGDACGGDSGGPLCARRNGKRILVGVTSWGYGCNTAGYPGVYSSIAEQLDWIISTAGGRSNIKGIAGGSNGSSGNNGNGGNNGSNGVSYSAPAPAPAPAPKPAAKKCTSDVSYEFKYIEKKNGKTKEKESTCDDKVGKKPSEVCHYSVKGGSGKVGETMCCRTCRNHM